MASYAGSPDHPAWYKNLLANPRCEIQVGKVLSEATARTVVDAAERARLWDKVSAQQPQYLKYAGRTDRIIPIVVLDIRSSRPAPVG